MTLKFLNRIKEKLKSVECRLEQSLVWIVNNEGNWKDIKNIFLTNLTGFIYTLKDLILLCDAVVIFKMIDKVLFPMLA